MKYLRTILYFAICLLATTIGLRFSLSHFSPSSRAIFDPVSKQCLLPQIRLVHTTLPIIQTSEPVAKRDVASRFYLQCSVRIQVGRVSGSGTICYYNASTNDVYIISCGHLFEGTENPGQSKVDGVKVSVFYKNNEKLPQPQSFEAQVLCHNAEEDISILTFKPDWVPQHYFVIAPENYPIQAGQSFESVGCDHAEETAAYTVRVQEGMESGRNLVTINNSPRPGRSGGGLLSNDGYYVGIVWGTSELDGTGYGYNVPLRRIYAYLGQYEQTKWLLSLMSQSQNYELLPIINKDGSLYPVPNGYFPSIISQLPALLNLDQ